VLADKEFSRQMFRSSHIKISSQIIISLIKLKYCVLKDCFERGRGVRKFFSWSFCSRNKKWLY